MVVVVCLLGLLAGASALSLGMKLSRADIMAPFVQGNALKVISGLQNFDASLVRNVARAAELG
jgi:hypothetical protein